MKPLSDRQRFAIHVAAKLALLSAHTFPNAPGLWVDHVRWRVRVAMKDYDRGR